MIVNWDIDTQKIYINNKYVSTTSTKLDAILEPLVQICQECVSIICKHIWHDDLLIKVYVIVLILKLSLMNGNKIIVYCTW